LQKKSLGKNASQSLFLTKKALGKEALGKPKHRKAIAFRASYPAGHSESLGKKMLRKKGQCINSVGHVKGQSLLL